MKWAGYIVFKLCLLGTTVGFVSCEKEVASCVEGRGSQVSEERTFDPFNRLYIEGRIDVSLVEDSVNFAVVTYGENGVGGIKTRFEDGELRITEENHCDWIRKIDPLPNVELHYTALNRILCEGAGTTEFSVPYTRDTLTLEVHDAAGTVHIDARCEKLNIVVHTGATDISARGTATDLYIYNSGYAPIRAEELVARTASVHNNNSGDTHINAWEHLYYQIYNTGDIHVYGNPQRTKWHQEGGGEVVGQ